MKKIYLSESQLKKIMKRVIQEQSPNYTTQEYELMLDSHHRNIIDSLDELKTLYFDIEVNDVIDQEDKESLLSMYKETLINDLGVDPRDLELGDYSDDYEETIDFDNEP